MLYKIITIKDNTKTEHYFICGSRKKLEQKLGELKEEYDEVICTRVENEFL